MSKCFNTALMLLLISTCLHAKPLKVGLFDDPPLMYLDESGKPTGLSIEILQQIADEKNWKLEFVRGTWNQCLTKVIDGEIDLLCGVVKTPERLQKIDYCNENIYIEWGVVFGGKNSNIKQQQDLEGKKIALMKGDVHARNFQRMMAAIGIAYEPVFVDKYDQIVESIENGQADAGVLNRFVGWKYQNTRNIKKTDIIFMPSPAYIVSAKGQNSEVLAQIDAEINRLKRKRDSKYHKLFDKYFGKGKDDGRVMWRIWIVGIISGFSIVCFAFLSILHIEMSARRKSKLPESVKNELVGPARRPQRIIITEPKQDITGAQVVQLYMPGNESGGDLFDYLCYNDHVFDVVLADIMGKGLPPHVLIKTISQAVQQAGKNPTNSSVVSVADIVNKAHDKIVNSLISLEQFITILYLRVDTRKMTLTMIDCGHSLAMWYHADTGQCSKLTSENMPIGFSDKARYKQSEYSISRGDVLLLYTDGLIEACDKQGNVYGQSRLEEIFLQNSHRGSRPVVEIIRNDLRTFVGRHSQKEDVTCVAIKIK